MTQPRPARPRPPASTIIAVALILILAVVTVVSAVTVLQLPQPITEQAERTDLLYQPVLAISLVVFFGVTAGIIWAMLRYRRRGPELPEQIHGSSSLELAWTIIPILILIPLFVWSFVLILDLKEQPAAAEADVVIDVIGHQWFWEFDYADEGFKVCPDKAVSSQQPCPPPDYEDLTPPALVVPVGQTILLRVSSADVVHSFYAPNTLYKIQAIPGNVNSMHFKVKADKAGVYSGQCYQFCGLRHSDMRFVLDARELADYESWLREQRQAQGVTEPGDLAAATDGSD